jgi:hypothetical protein
MHICLPPPHLALHAAHHHVLRRQPRVLALEALLLAPRGLLLALLLGLLRTRRTARQQGHGQLGYW